MQLFHSVSVKSVNETRLRQLWTLTVGKETLLDGSNFCTEHTLFLYRGGCEGRGVKKQGMRFLFHFAF